MPIEIKELHIKATVVDQPKCESPAKELSAEDLEQMKREIVRACVEEVIKILDDKRER